MLYLLVVILGGCATLPTQPSAAYPFRAEFTFHDESTGEDVSGAVMLESAGHGIAQAYGPMGLAVATAKIDSGRISVEDTWGQVLYQTSLPIDDLPGLLAGDLPRSKLLRRSPTEAGFCLRYIWGQIDADRSMRPIRLRQGKSTDLTFTYENGRICLSGTFDGKPLAFDVDVLEGGRWR